MLENKNLAQVWGNNEKRESFLKAYREWGQWITTPELELTYYRYILPDGTTIIALEYLRDKKYYSKNEPGVMYHIQRKGNPFCPGYSSHLSSVADLLKKAKIQLLQEAKNAKNTEEKLRKESDSDGA